MCRGRDEVEVGLVDHLQHRQLLEPALLVEQLEDRPRDEDRGEQVPEHADDHRQGEPLDLLGPDRRRGRRAESRSVTCESKIVTQARLNPLRICCAIPAPRSFSSRIRSKTSTLASTAMPIVSARPGQAGQRERRLHERHRADQQDHVQHQRDDRDEPREPVVDEHEDRHDEHRDLDREDALGDRVLAQGRADLLLLERGRVDARRQAPPLEDRDQVVDLLGLEPLPAPFDDPLVADLRVDRRGRHHDVVEQDRELVLEVVGLGQVLAGQRRRTAAPPGG